LRRWVGMMYVHAQTNEASGGMAGKDCKTARATRHAMTKHRMRDVSDESATSFVTRSVISRGESGPGALRRQDPTTRKFITYNRRFLLSKKSDE
jgi:hypothetical protein